MSRGIRFHAVFSPAKGFSRQDVKEWTSENIAPSTVVVSDGLSCFTAVTAAGSLHEQHVVDSDQSQKMECFTWVNTVLGKLKTAITGTYDSFRFPKYPHRYLAEYQYRFNRRFDLSSMFSRLFTAAARTGSRREAWLRLAEDWR